MKRTPDQIRAAIAAKQAEYAKQIVKVDDNWTVRRADALNWEVIKKHPKTGKYQSGGYYGTILAAFNALPAKMLSESAQSSLQALGDTHRAIQDSIRLALVDAKNMKDL